MEIPYAKRDISIEELKKAFSAFDEIKIALLFGSRATKEANRFSDYDIAILTETLDVWEFGELFIKVAKALDLNERDLDLIDLKRANSLLKESIKNSFVILKGSEDEVFRILRK